MARRKIVAGNWKMNMTPSQAVKLVEELKPLVESDSVDVVYCVPEIDITTVVEAVKVTNVQVGAQNMYFEEKGAYTGEISAEIPARPHLIWIRTHSIVMPASRCSSVSPQHMIGTMPTSSAFFTFLLTISSVSAKY